MYTKKCIFAFVVLIAILKTCCSQTESTTKKPTTKRYPVRNFIGNMYYRYDNVNVVMLMYCILCCIVFMFYAFNRLCRHVTQFPHNITSITHSLGGGQLTQTRGRGHRIYGPKIKFFLYLNT